MQKKSVPMEVNGSSGIYKTFWPQERQQELSTKVLCHVQHESQYYADLSFIFSVFWFPICKIEIIAGLHYTKSLQR